MNALVIYAYPSTKSHSCFFLKFCIYKLVCYSRNKEVIKVK